MTEFICEFCKRILSSKASLNYHKKTAKICLSLQNKESNFSCKECGKSFNDNRNLSQHMEKCKGKQNYIVKIACLEKEIENCNRIIEEKINYYLKKIQ